MQEAHFVILYTWPNKLIAVQLELNNDQMVALDAAASMPLLNMFREAFRLFSQEILQHYRTLPILLIFLLFFFAT